MAGPTGPIGVGDTGPIGPEGGPTGPQGLQGVPGAVGYLPADYEEYIKPTYLGVLPSNGTFYYATTSDSDIFLYMFISNPDYSRNFNITVINLGQIPTTSPGFWKASQLSLDPVNITPVF